MQSFRELRSPYLLMAGNVLNELKDKPGVSVDERMADLAVAVGRTLHPEGTALFVEPGTRLSGTLTAKLRETALEEGLTPVAPCPHLGPCPLLGLCAAPLGSATHIAAGGRHGWRIWPVTPSCPRIR